MQKSDDMPLWVFLAFSSIERRKTALWLIWSCVLFTVYCVPWGVLFPEPAWLRSVFLIEDWSWFATMIPLSAWYGLSLRWLDGHGRWPGPEAVPAARHSP